MKLPQPAYNRKNTKRKKGKEFHSLARLICRRVSDSVALTNELWKGVGKGLVRRKRPQKGVDDMEGEGERSSRGRSALSVAEIEHHAFWFT